MIDAYQQVEHAFPEIDRIEDDELREGVISAWVMAIEETGVTDLESLPWLPPEQARLDLPDETLVAHVRDVVAGSVALAESLLETRGEGVALSMDLVVAGALVHDVSKPYEYDGGEETEIGRLLGHPHFGVHVVAEAGLPVAVQHVALAHSHRTAIEPATLEAELVTRVDQVAAAAIRLRSVPDLRDV